MDETELKEIIKLSNSRISLPDLQLLERCCDFCQAKQILEIGSADGGSSVVLGTKATERAGFLYCIEPKPRGRMLENMKQYGITDFKIIPKASPWIPFDLVPDEIDLLFIDGYHEIRWALVDYHYWQPKVRHGGVIVFHDTCGGSAEDHRDAAYGKPGYVPLVQRAINIILKTDADQLKDIDSCSSPRGGCRAFQKL